MINICEAPRQFFRSSAVKPNSLCFSSLQGTNWRHLAFSQNTRETCNSVKGTNFPAHIFLWPHTRHFVAFTRVESRGPGGTPVTVNWRDQPFYRTRFWQIGNTMLKIIALSHSGIGWLHTCITSFSSCHWLTNYTEVLPSNNARAITSFPWPFVHSAAAMKSSGEVLRNWHCATQRTSKCLKWLLPSGSVSLRIDSSLYNIRRRQQILSLGKCKGNTCRMETALRDTESPACSKQQWYSGSWTQRNLCSASGTHWKPTAWQSVPQQGTAALKTSFAWELKWASRKVGTTRDVRSLLTLKGEAALDAIATDAERRQLVCYHSSCSEEEHVQCRTRAPEIARPARDTLPSRRKPQTHSSAWLEKLSWKFAGSIPMRALDFYADLILPAAVGPWGPT
jgi:hypothetical protein